MPAKIASSSAILSVAVGEIGDRVDIAAAERGGEGEDIGTAEARQHVRAGPPSSMFAPGIAEYDIGDFVAGEVDRRSAGVAGGGKHLDRGAGAEHIAELRAQTLS